MTDIVGKLWGFCHTLRHDGIDCGGYIEQLTYLLFLKMIEEKGADIFNEFVCQSPIPAQVEVVPPFLEKTRVKSMLDPSTVFGFDCSTAPLQHRNTKLGELARGRKFNFKVCPPVHEPDWKSGLEVKARVENLSLERGLRGRKYLAEQYGI